MTAAKQILTKPVFHQKATAADHLKKESQNRSIKF